MKNGNSHYVGYTEDIKQRICEHNEGKCKYTSKYKPWKLETYIAFTDKDKAVRFEKYLKNGSGRMFSIRHL